MSDEQVLEALEWLNGFIKAWDLESNSRAMKQVETIRQALKQRESKPLEYHRFQRESVDVEGLKKSVMDMQCTKLEKGHILRATARMAACKTIDHLHEKGYLSQPPEGYALVPIEPTFEMESSGMFKASEIYEDEELAPNTDECAMIYKAMIKAAGDKT